MFKCKFALVFLIVLAVYLKQSQGTPIHAKKAAAAVAAVKVPLVAAKVGIAKSVAAKIKLAAFKKWAAIKTAAKLPFILGKKAALLKIGAVKSLAALKVAKATKVLSLASKKAAAVAAIPAAVATLPAAAAAAILPTVASVAATVPQTEVVDIISIPVSESHYEVVQPNAQFSSSIVSTYKDALDVPQTYSNGYSVSLLPEGEVSSQYQYYTVPTANQEAYVAIDHQDVK